MDDGSLSTVDQITGLPFMLVIEAVAVGTPQLAEYQNPLVKFAYRRGPPRIPNPGRVFRNGHAHVAAIH